MTSSRLKARLLCAAAVTLLGGSANALPTGGVVIAQSGANGADITAAGKLMTIAQHDRRVVIDWRSFNVGSGEAVNYQQAGNAIAFNRIALGADIEGTITGQGGVWLFSPGGLIIGATAKINVGSFIGSTGTLDNDGIAQAIAVAQPGQLNTVSSAPSEGSPELIVREGATINAGPAGFVVLQGENIRQAGDVSGGAVGYIVAKGASANYIEIPAGPGQPSAIILQGNISTSGQAALRFNHTGTTQGGVVILLAPAAAATQGFAGAINLGGVVEAGGVQIPNVPSGLTVHVGDDYTGPASGGRLTLDTTQGVLTVDGQATLGAYDARLGPLQAQQITAGALNRLSVEGPLQASGDIALGVSPLAGLMSLRGDVVAQGAISLSGAGIDIDPGVTVNAAAAGATGQAGALSILAARRLDAAPTSLLFAGPLEGDPTAPVVIRAGSINEGGVFPGDIAVGSVIGSSVDIGALGTAGQGGNILLGGEIYGVDGVSVISTAAGPASAGRIAAQGQVLSRGAVLIRNADGGDIIVGPGAVVQSDLNGDGAGALALAADRDITAAASSRLLGGAGTADVTISAGAASSGGDLQAGQVDGLQVTLEATGGSQRAGDVTTLAAVHGASRVAMAGDGGASLREIDSGGDVTVAMAGAVRAGGDITAAAGLSMSGAAIRVEAVTLRADAGATGQSLSLVAAGDIIADPASLLAAGAVGEPTGGVVVQAGAGGGGSLRLGFVEGASLDASAVAGPAGGGGIILNGEVFGADHVTVATSGAPSEGGVPAIRINSEVRSNGAVQVGNRAGGDILLSGATKVQSDADASGSGDLSLVADRDILAQATSQLTSGSNISVQSGAAAGGGDLSLGQVTGATIAVQASGGGDRAGGVLLAGAVSAGSGLTVQQSGGPASGLGVRVAADLQSGGALSIQSVRDVAFDPGVTVHAIDGGSGASLEVGSGGAVSVGAGAQLVGEKGLSLQAAGLVSVDEDAVLQGGYGGGGPAGLTWPQVAFDPAQGGVFIQAADLNLVGDIRSVAPEGRGDILLSLVGDGAVGAVSGGGFSISGPEMARLSGRAVMIAAGGDLSVGDLDLDSTTVEQLWLGAGGSLRVSGKIDSAGAQPVDLRLGFLASVGEPDGPMLSIGAIPDQLVLSGSLGGGGPLGQVGMAANGDILMGSDAYIAEASDPAFTPGASKAAPPQPGWVFVQADGLQLASGGRILQQNTAGRFRFSGLTIGAPTAERPLIVALPGDGSARAPSVIDLYGELQTPGGAEITGRFTADAPFLLDSGLASLDSYRFNGCVFGQGFSCAGDTRPYFPRPIDVVASQTTQSFEAVVSAVESFLTVPKSEDDEDRDSIGLPVTESGNGDLWIGAPVEEDQP